MSLILNDVRGGHPHGWVMRGPDLGGKPTVRGSQNFGQNLGSCSSEQYHATRLGDDTGLGRRGGRVESAGGCGARVAGWQGATGGGLQGGRVEHD